MGKPGPTARLMNPVSYGVLLEYRDLQLLRKIAAARGQHLSELVRERLRGDLKDAEKRFGTTIPKDTRGLR